MAIDIRLAIIEQEKMLERLHQALIDLEQAPQPGNIFPNQREAGDEIIHGFSTIRYGLLRADVQSGKSGTYHYAIQQMFERGLIDRAYILCGSHETELRNQCNRDVEEYHKDKPYQSMIRVIFRQDFKRSKMIIKRSLIAIDETHLVMERDQTLNKFLKDHKLGMTGSTDYMQAKDIYMLSIDATPYVEESCMAYGDSHPKFRVVLKNSDIYYGPQHYFRDGHVQPTYNLELEENKIKFVQLLHSIPNKFAFIRVQKMRGKQYKHIMECIARAGADVVHFVSEKDGPTQEIVLTVEQRNEFEEKYHRVLPCLEVEPANTTIIIVDGRLRCGKRVCKNYIGFIWESSKMANTDTILQSLFGRVCGNDVPFNKPLIFIPERLIQENEHGIISKSDLERSFIKEGLSRDKNQVAMIPRFAKHILSGNVMKKAIINDIEVFQCTPILFKLDPDQIELLDPTKNSLTKALCFQKLRTSMYNIKRNANLTLAQQDEICEWIESHTSTDCNLRNFSESINANYHKNVVMGYKSRSASSEHTSDCAFLTFCVTHRYYELHREHSIPGNVFAIFYTKSKGFKDMITKEARICMHDGKTHFSIPNE